MADEKWQKVREIFDSALRQKPNERRRFVHEACGEDKLLYAEVESLLSSLGSAESFMETPAVAKVAEMIEPATKKLEKGSSFGHYEIVEQIGVGGMGVVYLAKDRKLDRKVAIKILNEEFSQDESNLQRFVSEAKAASALNHPNILTIYEFGEAEDARYIVSEYIEGKTLREIIRESRLRVPEILDISIQIAGALSAAHKAHLVHRDIKPENIMIRPDGYVKVLDFGLAKLVEQKNKSMLGLEEPTVQQNLTAKGVILGTVNYMSPEQAKGDGVDERTDIFSLGVLIYEIFAGKPPFDGRNAIEIIASILNKDPVPLSRQTHEVPHEIERIINKALRKDREERYQTAKDLLIDLKDVRQNLDFRSKLERTAAPDREESQTRVLNATTSDIAPHTTSSAEYIVNTIKRHKRFAVLGVVPLIIASIALLFFFFFNRPAAVLTEKDTVLLADFVNTTHDPIFDGTLRQALAVQLGQSPFLNIFSDDRVREALKFMGRPVEERVTRDVGREICQRQGLKAMLAGSIASMGSHYVITLEAIDVQKGDTIAREQVEAESKERVLRALGEAATKLREQLGESLASIQKFDAPIEQATTSSLEAFKAYTLGVEQHHQGKYLEAVPLYKRAAELDPNFALAYARLAAVYVNSRQFGLAADASQKAYDLRDRVSERERLFIAANYYDDVTREVEKKIETLELWKRTYPLDFVPHNNLALQYNNLGQYEKAVEEAREAIRLNPNAAPAHSNLAQAFVGLNRIDEAKEVIERALAQKIETIWMHRNLYLIAFVRGDAAAMKQQIEWANGKPDEYHAQRWQAETAAFSGQLRKAREFSDRAIELALRRDLKDVAAEVSVSSAARSVFFGDCKHVKGQTAQALAITQSYWTRIIAANALAACGEFTRTQAITDEMLKRYPKDTMLNKLFLPLIQAHGEMSRGDAAQAIKLLETTTFYEGVQFRFPIAYLRGQAYLSQQKGAEAAAEFQKILDHRDWPTSPLYPLAHLGLARAAVLAGDTARARRAYQDFFALWKDADADIPILIEAKQEYEKLK